MASIYHILHSHPRTLGRIVLRLPILGTAYCRWLWGRPMGQGATNAS